MITSIFSKSRPINFLIVFLLSFLALIIAVFKFSTITITANSIAQLLAVFLCCFLSALLVDFIVSKNSLSQKGNAEVLLFSLFLLTIPQVFLDWNIVLSNFLVLLALRRIISLRTPKEHIKKLFDSGFLIGLASIFYFWALLFFILIFIGLLFYSVSEIKKWVIPYLGVFTVAIIAISFSLIVNNDFFTTLNVQSTINFNYNAYNSVQLIVAITMFLSFGLWCSVYYLKGIKKKMKTSRPSYKVVLAATVIAAVIVTIAPKKDGSEFLFIFAPLAIIFSNYIETIDEKWFKMLFTIVIVAIPFILLLF